MGTLTPQDYCPVLIDEDDMTSNVDFRPPSQQSVKAYVDNRTYLNIQYISDSAYMCDDTDYYKQLVVSVPTNATGIYLPHITPQNAGKPISILFGSKQPTYPNAKVVVQPFSPTEYFIYSDNTVFELISLYESIIFINDGINKWSIN